MSWIYKGKVFTEQDIDNYVGFVYIIIEKSTGKKYIGQKKFFSAVTRKPLKGKKNKRRSKKQSDWQDYFGSNTPLQEAVQQNGPDNYHREIIHLCETKAKMNYLESKTIFETDAILDNNYYNSWVSARINRSQVLSLCF